MALNPFNWSPSTGLNDTNAFPSKDTNFRAHMQSLLNQVKTYFNNDVATELAAKANKTQEILIQPTLINGWVNYGEPEPNVRYFKDNFGLVHIIGMVKSGGTTSTIFTLPAGYRPSSNLLFATWCYTGVCAIYVRANGDVQCYASVSNTWLSISLPCFKAEQ